MKERPFLHVLVYLVLPTIEDSLDSLCVMNRWNSNLIYKVQINRGAKI